VSNQKVGLEYFPLDIDFFDDDKIAFISARFQEKGEIIALKLLCKIYRDGYYCNWGEDESILFSKRVLGDSSQYILVQEIVNELIKRNFFDKILFEKYHILTSKGIQKRYLKACERRKSVEILKEFLLTDISKFQNVYIISQNVDILNENVDMLNNPTAQSVNILPQSKVKYSKVKESKAVVNACVPHDKNFKDGNLTAAAAAMVTTPSKKTNSSSDGETPSLNKLIEFYNNNIGMITPFVAEDMKHWLDDGVEADLLIRYMEVACERNVRKWAYIKSMMKGNFEANIKTLKQYKSMLLAKEKPKLREGDVNFNNFCRELGVNPDEL
jgi:DnaD/phage-associated family protein